MGGTVLIRTVLMMSLVKTMVGLRLFKTQAALGRGLQCLCVYKGSEVSSVRSHS